MLRLLLIAIIAQMLGLLSAQAAQPVTGRWVTADKKAEVTIQECGERVCGRVTQILVPTPKGPPVDEYNPDPKLRGRPILGLSILDGFTEMAMQWVGTIYSPEEGKTYRSTLRRNPDGTLNVQGCFFIFCKTQIWQPARDAAAE